MAKPPTFITTLTGIANISLSMLGEKFNTQLIDIATDTGDLAKLVNQFIYPAIRDVQFQFRWDELVTRVVLTSPDDMTGNPAYPWGYRYALPDDYLTPAWQDQVDYEIEGGFVYCNWSDNYVFPYHKYSIDPAEWTSGLLEVVKCRLAISLCMPLTENQIKYDNLLTELERIILPRDERVSSYGKKHPNSTYKQGNLSKVRGRSH